MTHVRVAVPADAALHPGLGLPVDRFPAHLVDQDDGTRHEVADPVRWLVRALT